MDFPKVRNTNNSGKQNRNNEQKYRLFTVPVHLMLNHLLNFYY